MVRLLLNQIGRRLTEDLHAKEMRHRLLLMLDEFPALGRLDFFEFGARLHAGYGLKSFLRAVALAQSTLDAGADYLLAVKDNQPTLHAEIAQLGAALAAGVVLMDASYGTNSALRAGIAKMRWRIERDYQ